MRLTYPTNIKIVKVPCTGRVDIVLMMKAFENGADFVCLGMYDFQVVDDVNLTIDILGSLGKRERPWYS